MSTPALNRNPIVQTTIVGIGIFVLFHALYYGKEFVVPLLFATILAILLDGVVGFSVRKLRFPRTLAILIVLLLFVALALGLVFLIGYQGSSFVEDLPKLAERISKAFHSVMHWVAETTGLGDQKMDEFYEKTKKDQMGKSSVVMRNTLTNFGDVLAILFLMPVYIFMLLYYKSHLLEFIHRVFSKDRHPAINDILSNIKSLIQFYLLGLITELFIVAGLNSLGLTLIGVDYALLLGLISGIMNLIPYIGSLIAGALAAIVAASSSTPIDAVWVIGSFTFVQFVDNTFVVPLIVGSRVKLNALVSLVGVVAGGALWGIAGMILSIPMLGILKAIFDKTEALQPWGFLLGGNDDKSPPEKPKQRLARAVSRVTKKR